MGVLALPLIKGRGVLIARGFHDQCQREPACHVSRRRAPGGFEILIREPLKGVKEALKVPLDIFLAVQQRGQGDALKGAPFEITLLVEGGGFKEMKIPLVCF